MQFNACLLYRDDKKSVSEPIPASLALDYYNIGLVIRREITKRALSTRPLRY